MTQLDTARSQEGSALTKLIAWVGRLFVAVVIPLLAFLVIYYGFIFLRDTKADRWVMATVAIIWGVGGVALLYWVFNGIVERQCAVCGDAFNTATFRDHCGAAACARVRKLSRRSV